MDELRADTTAPPTEPNDMGEIEAEEESHSGDDDPSTEPPGQNVSKVCMSPLVTRLLIFLRSQSQLLPSRRYGTVRAADTAIRRQRP